MVARAAPVGDAAGAPRLQRRPAGALGVGLANRFFAGFAEETRRSFTDTLTRLGADLGTRTRVT
ncbi:hypothetical protein GCM10023096_87100 [Nonomuraea ferruginea]